MKLWGSRTRHDDVAAAGGQHGTVQEEGGNAMNHHGHHQHHQHHHGHHAAAAGDGDAGFSRETAGLAGATAPEVVELRDGDVFALAARPVRKRLGETTLRMLAYNGSIPGPTLRVPQGATVTVEFANETDLDTTMHWHGLRLDNEFDGVPHGHPHHGMQPPVARGGRFTYRLRFPDPGVFWYHPHMREDYAQELGLYGNIVVVPADPTYWSPLNREVALTLDDILIEGDDVAPSAGRSRTGWRWAASATCSSSTTRQSTRWTPARAR